MFGHKEVKGAPFALDELLKADISTINLGKPTSWAKNGPYSL